MTVVEHLEELRYRIVVCVAAVLVGIVVAYVFYEPLLRLLKQPLDTGGRIGGREVTEVFVPGIAGPFILRMKVSAFGGLALASPVWLYQLWRFITPGLMPREKKLAIPFVFSSMALFAVGTWFAFLILPTGIRFLLSFVNPELNQQPFITLQDYLRFVIYMILAFGITFEFPIVLVFLAWVDVLSSRSLRKWRRYAFFLVFVVAAVATPSGDPFSQVAMAAPLYVLYELSILVIRFGLKR